MRYFLGADLGGTKTHIVIADENGRVASFGEGGPANHQSVGYEGMFESLNTAFQRAMSSARLSAIDIAGAGFGIAGYDWPSEKPRTQAVLDRLGLDAPYLIVNDTIPSLVAGAEEGWGVAVISGTGCNCRGWDREHQREGRVTGYGTRMGEGAGASELIFRALQLVGRSWAKRVPLTALSDVFIQYTGAKDLDGFIEGYTEDQYSVGPDIAPLIFDVARQGDPVACDLIRWAGTELGEMANSVIRQLSFQELAFDVVLSGSMFRGGDLLIDPMRETIHKIAPQARLVRLKVSPVMGAVLIGMSAAGLETTPVIRKTICHSLSDWMNTPTRENP
ncbi:MAG: ATPase [Chloroflexi bacterium]|nr:ATPase [Chloroflexota bacterium]